MFFFTILCWKYCFQACMRVKTIEFSQSCAVPPDPQLYVEQTAFVHLHLTLLRFLPNMQ